MVTFFSSISAPARGALWMTAAAGNFALMSWAIRELAPIGASEVVFLRSLFGLFMVLPWLIFSNGMGNTRLFRRPRMRLFCLRGVLSHLAMLAWFYALQNMVLADAVALQFTLPLFTVLFAIIFFREAVGVRRWMAILIGFGGALVIIRPGFAEINDVALIVILSAALYASANMIIKRLLSDEKPITLVFYLHVITLPLALAGAIPFWIWPGWADVPWILVLAGTGSLAHYCFSRAMAVADASVVMPFDYLRLPFLALIGFLAFGEVPEIWSWIGAAIITGANFYIIRREARLARAGASP